jgi:hypothetical protein
MEAAITRFVNYVKRRYGKTSTAKHYANDLSLFARQIRNKAPQEITPPTLIASSKARLQQG